MASVILPKQQVSRVSSVGRGGQVIASSVIPKTVPVLPLPIPSPRVNKTFQFDPTVALSLFVVSVTVLLCFAFMKFTIGALDSMTAVAHVKEDNKTVISALSNFDLVHDSLSLDSRISMIATDKKKTPRKEIIPAVAEKPVVEVSQKDLVNQVYTIIASTNKRQTKALQLARSIVAEGMRQKYDPLFVAAVIKSESAFNEMAVSHVGAQGLMQIMPATGKYLLRKHEEQFPTAVKLTDRDVNIKLGIKYLRELEQMYQGNRLLTLIAYNWGPGKLDRAIRSGRGVPKECIKYALKILRDHNLWQA